RGEIHREASCLQLASESSAQHASATQACLLLDQVIAGLLELSRCLTQVAAPGCRLCLSEVEARSALKRSAHSAESAAQTAGQPQDEEHTQREECGRQGEPGRGWGFRQC